MKFKIVFGILSLVSVIVALAMLPSICIALYDGSEVVGSFAFSIMTAISLAVFLSLPILMTKERFNQNIGIREGVGIVGFSWVIASAIGAMPYYFGVDISYSDAFFETMSGFTTTGATIFSEIETLPRAILLWRSLTHWIGGMGIIVLSLAVLPFLGVRGIELYKAEVPGVNAEKITPRLHQTASKLWTMYVTFTLSETILLTFSGMNLFDAFCHSCSTIATGGFSTKNNSIAYFPSPIIQWILILFMFLSGINFSLYFLALSKKFKDFFQDEELRAYIYIVLFATLAMSVTLYFSWGFTGIESTIRKTAFHVVSVITTTGFITHDYNKWHEFTKFLFVLLMFIGACGGSTGGGCKVSRFLLLGKLLSTELKKLLHPRAVITSRLNSKPISSSTMISAGAFFVLYMLLLVGATLFTCAFNIDLLTSFTGVLTCLSNVGPGLNALGPIENFSWLPASVKWLFSFCMLAGRLELFAVILLFLPATYRK